MENNTLGAKVIGNDIPEDLLKKSVVMEKVNIGDSLKKLGKFVWLIAKIITSVITSAIVLYVLAGLVPSLREQMPALYTLVDAILSSFDGWLKNRTFMSKWY